MSITVLFFASLREELGQSSTQIEIEKNIPIQAVWQQATGQTEIPSNIRIACNQTYCNATHMVTDGDEIAFFPPVTGG